MLDRFQLLAAGPDAVASQHYACNRHWHRDEQRRPQETVPCGNCFGHQRERDRQYEIVAGRHCPATAAVSARAAVTRTLPVIRRRESAPCQPAWPGPSASRRDESASAPPVHTSVNAGTHQPRPRGSRAETPKDDAMSNDSNARGPTPEKVKSVASTTTASA